jgi:dephospho-CoA kinase
MSVWPGKFVIGLTGNIATGKSEVRGMLQQLGAAGIDADALAHQVISKDEPAYLEVVEAFGTSILNQEDQIDRARLGQIVFSDPAALARLEGMIHPQVRKAVFQLVQQAPEPVVVIEAIKLIESGYLKLCDSIWVTYASEQVQLDRLIQQRSMSETLARQRIAAQASQNEKLAVADVIIRNEGTIADLWQQVESNWKRSVNLSRSG